MEFTTHFELHSQTTRLFDGKKGRAWKTARDSHPLWRPVPRNISFQPFFDAIFKLQSWKVSNLSFCRFTRRYWGNPCWFLFLRLLICLSSAGSLTLMRERRRGQCFWYWTFFFSGKTVVDEGVYRSSMHTVGNTPRCNVRSKIRWFRELQFVLRIAFRCVLHRCENQEIRCWKF